MKKTLTYDQLSCQLRVEGLPDLSAGQGSDDLGILTGWSLRWAGRPELEGQRNHLEALITAVLPYARHLVSGLRRGFGDQEGPIWIGPADGTGHTLRLVSGQSGNPSLDLQLDDAELADLVRVLDQLRVDPRVKLHLAAPAERPLRATELISRGPLQRRLAAPLGGVAVLALTAAVAMLLPPPPRQPLRPATTTTTTNSATGTAKGISSASGTSSASGIGTAAGMGATTGTAKLPTPTKPAQGQH